MKNTALLLMAIVLGSLLINCAGNKPSPQTKPLPPEWWLQLPDDPDMIFGKGAGESTDLMLACDEATLTALGDMAMKIESEISALRLDFFAADRVKSQILCTFDPA